MEKVLVCGGAGYIGSVLCGFLLDEGKQVTCLDNLTFGPQSLLHLADREGFRFMFGDVRDKSVLERVVKDQDVIIPLAAIVGAPQCNLNPVDAVLTNRDSVINLNSIRSSNQKFIYATTNSGYGTTSGETFCTEETPLNPISLYGRTKSDAEKAVLDSGKDVITLRLATVFGMSPRMRTDLLVNNFVMHAINEGYLVIYEGGFKRNYAHVTDISRCFAHCIEHFDAMKNRPYNVGLDEANLSKMELAEKIKEHVPKLDIISREVGSDVDRRNYIVSNARIAKEGFRCIFDLDFGIAEMIKGYGLMFGKEVARQ
ncbi:MAG: NAD(P)-dependent oxidoreductase [Nanoarchaeota archaeon]|nr:NAD(P)-dependent oxidoreductase [Nanoarchaeota archaeon]MBU4086790.1 NAD(P)-dependent oxidoreductase [Nanoarchaeota archaeon]